jgi:Family of unknown function (DUF6526)
MAESVPQNFSNHSRLDPPFHFFVLPVFALTVIITIVHLVVHPRLHSAWVVIFALAATVLAVKIRTYALKLQDRIIRLEERLRLAILLDKPLRARIGEFSESQLVALRFASDAELPALAGRTLSEKLSNKDIKKAIRQWKPDYWRV